MKRFLYLHFLGQDYSISGTLVSQSINPFLANIPISYPLKTPENLWLSGVFRGNKMGTLSRNGLRWSISYLLFHYFLFRLDLHSNGLTVKVTVSSVKSW